MNSWVLEYIMCEYGILMHNSESLSEALDLSSELQLNDPALVRIHS